MNLGKTLQGEGKKQGLSQQNLADTVGVTKRAIAYWEKGTKSTSVESADKIFKAPRISIKIGEWQLVKLAFSGKAGERKRGWGQEFLSGMERLGSSLRLR